MSLIQGAATCVIALAEIQLSPTDTGWDEKAQITIDAEGICPWVDIVLPAGVSLERWRAKIDRLNGRSGRIDSSRQERRTRDLAGTGALRLHLPEMRSGDRLSLRIERSWPVGPYQWDAAAQGSQFSELEVAGPLTPPSWAHAEAGGFWVQEAPPGSTWSVPHPDGDAPDVSPIAAATVSATVELELVIPGDPMRTLYPGGGSSVVQHWTLHAPPQAGTQGFVFPLPAQFDELQIVGAHQLRDDSVLLTATAGQALDHQVRWTADDAPSYGMRPALPGATVTQVTIKGERARIEWEQDRAWWISAVDLKPLLPERARLLRSLDRRFRRTANPEPALPASLRGQPADLELVAQLRPQLQLRTGIDDRGVAPLFPRKLIQARNSRSMSSVEAALSLWAQLSQVQIPSAWAVVQPAPTGPQFFRTPAAYTAGLVGVQTEDGAVWIDPGCTFCASFELRPHLEGASMLSPAGRATPDPTPGAARVVDRVDEGVVVRTVTLEGPAALLERQRLGLERPTQRSTALTARWCGACKLTAAEGLGKPGTTIVLRFELGDSDPIDPLTPSLFESEFSDWHDWVGERSWTRAGSAPSRQWSDGGVSWTQEARDGERIETLTIAERRLTPGLWGRWQESRTTPPEPQDTETSIEDPGAPDEAAPDEPAP